MKARESESGASEPATWRCIVGPTGAGKSALALGLAERRGLSIVSADSRQVYRGFDIGTAKPSVAEQARVPHFGLDVMEPTERYSARRWATDALAWSTIAAEQGRPAVIVGGTGLYVRALVEPFDPVPELDADRRAQLEPWLSTRDREELVRWCARLDPSRSHLGRTQLLRAIETALLTGTRLSDWLQRSPPRRPTNVRYLVVDPGVTLAAHIASRVHQMVRDGFLEEVIALRERVPADAPAWNACGYRAMRDALGGLMSRDAAIERTIIESRQYAKRQRTWFRHQLPETQVTHLDPADPEAMARVLAWWDLDTKTPGDSASPPRAPIGALQGVGEEALS